MIKKMECRSIEILSGRSARAELFGFSSIFLEMIDIKKNPECMSYLIA
jgi:hypothetical protein